MNEATASKASTKFGGKPSTRPALSSLRSGADGISGGGRNISNASGATVSTTTAANTSIVSCQPNNAMPRSKTVGQIAPATY